MRLLGIVGEYARDAEDQHQHRSDRQKHGEPIEQQAALHTDALLFDLSGQPNDLFDPAHPSPTPFCVSHRFGRAPPEGQRP